MKIRIAARQSHLARLQAMTVARTLERAQAGVECEFQFRESLGDINAQDPLWKMPEKGVFTQDFVQDLLAGRSDMVVHSWKDLPIEATPGTRIVATLPREDARDLLLVRRAAWDARDPRGARLRVLTSSPRRTYNLAAFLPWALPQPVAGVEFLPVRGNIPTRLRKLVAGEGDGLVVAKAALDRLLTAPGAEFASVAAEIRAVLRDCLFMVLPYSANPTAAAQGALAIEVSQTAPPWLTDLLARVNCETTFRAVERERKILASHGGGCHQKIGVNVLSRPYGDVLFLKGLTDRGQRLDERTLSAESDPGERPADAGSVFPLNPKDMAFFERRPLPLPQPRESRAYWVARADAWPEGWRLGPDDLLWSAGLESWRKLAARGIWVNGSSEGLGEQESPRLHEIAGRPLFWTKLSHDEGVRSEGFEFLATYELVPKGPVPDLRGKTHFFWMSGSAFRRALAAYPEIRGAHHSAGLGLTQKVLRELLGPEARIGVALHHSDWLRSLGLA